MEFGREFEICLSWLEQLSAAFRSRQRSVSDSLKPAGSLVCCTPAL
jgi:hypothetical protein